MSLRLIQKLHARGAFVIAAERVVLARIGVVDVIVAMHPLPGDAHRERVGQAAADGAIDVGRSQFAVGAGEEGVEILRRLLAGELDDARRRVAAEQRALRTARDFDVRLIVDRRALQDRCSPSPRRP